MIKDTIVHLMEVVRALMKPEYVISFLVGVLGAVLVVAPAGWYLRGQIERPIRGLSEDVAEMRGLLGVREDKTTIMKLEEQVRSSIGRGEKVEIAPVFFRPSEVGRGILTSDIRGRKLNVRLPENMAMWLHAGKAEPIPSSWSVLVEAGMGVIVYEIRPDGTEVARAAHAAARF